MYRLSVYAHIVSGIVLLIGIVYLAIYISKIMSRDSYQIVMLILLLSIALSVHGISHAGLESAYQYNPLSLLNL